MAIMIMTIWWYDDSDGSDDIILVVNDDYDDDWDKNNDLKITLNSMILTVSDQVRLW